MYIRAFLLLSVVALSYEELLEATIDTKRLQNILQEGIKSKDPATLYYAVQGLKLLNVKIPDICQTIKAIKPDDKNVETSFYTANAAALSGCLNSLSPLIMGAATKALDKKDASIPELYHAVYTLKALGRGDTMDKDSALKNLVALLKKDDSHLNYGYVFGLCEHIGCTDWTVSHADDVLASADESGGKMLYFEGGLPATAMILSTVLSSYKAAKKPCPLTLAQKTKFAMYLVSRRGVTTPRGAATLLQAATVLADEQPNPMAVVIRGNKQISQDSENIEVAVTDLLGRPITAVKADDVIAQSGTRLADDVVVLSKQQLVAKSGEPGVFVLQLNRIKSQYGIYKIVLTAAGETLTFTITVLGEMSVESVEIGIGDIDGTTSPKLTTLRYPNKLQEKLQADHLQKVSLKFTIRDQTAKPMVVQQAFVRVASQHDEAIFIAETDNTKAYKVDLTVENLGKLLKYASGAHSISLYLGDSSVKNPIQWDLGTITCSYPKDANAVGEVRTSVKSVRRGPLPEIQHLFREPEPRPPRIVSDVFAAACAAPLLLLLGLWASLRVNLSNMPLAPSALLFHLSLGASLALYGVFWLQLSMFDTVRYLLPLGLLTFLSGHRLLRRLANKTVR